MTLGFSSLLVLVVAAPIGAARAPGCGRDALHLQPTSESRWYVAQQQDTGKGWDPMHFHKPSDQDLQARLTDLQYEVTQRAATERPFHNEFWDNHKAGIYVDIVSGEPLFSSLDKFESGTGWPSFTRPLDSANVREDTDRSYGMVRTEVRSTHAGSHLGHLFPDGPPPTGQRYCINSAALRFIPVDRLQTEGYGAYLALFQASDHKDPTTHD